MDDEVGVIMEDPVLDDKTHGSDDETHGSNDKPDDDDYEGDDELAEADLFVDDLFVQDHEPDDIDSDDELAEDNLFVDATGRKSFMDDRTQEIDEELDDDDDGEVRRGTCIRFTVRGTGSGTALVEDRYVVVPGSSGSSEDFMGGTS